MAKAKGGAPAPKAAIKTSQKVPRERPAANKIEKSQNAKKRPCNSLGSKGPLILPSLAKAMLNQLGDATRASLRAKLSGIGGIKVFSLFAGSELQDLCSAVLAQVLRLPHGCGMRTIAACECNPGKQAFIQHVIEGSKGDRCIFKYVHDLKQDAAPCAVHGQSCTVPDSARIVVGGWSCKSLSKANKAYQMGQHSSCLRHGTGTSGSTFHDMLAFLDRHETVLCYIGENVDDVLRLESDNRAAIAELFTAMGWCLHVFEVEASSHGLPQWRRRAWIIAVHCGRAGITSKEANDALRKVEATVRRLEVDCVPLEELLLPNDDEYVQAVNARYDAAAAVRAAAPRDEGKWRADLLTVLREVGYSWRDLKMPAEYEGNPRVHALTERERTAHLMPGYTVPHMIRYIPHPEPCLATCVRIQFIDIGVGMHIANA